MLEFAGRINTLQTVRPIGRLACDKSIRAGRGEFLPALKMTARPAALAVGGNQADCSSEVSEPVRFPADRPMG